LHRASRRRPSAGVSDVRSEPGQADDQVVRDGEQKRLALLGAIAPR